MQAKHPSGPPVVVGSDLGHLASLSRERVSWRREVLLAFANAQYLCVNAQYLCVNALTSPADNPSLRDFYVSTRLYLPSISPNPIPSLFL
jgi:hypothetical protein